MACGALLIHCPKTTSTVQPPASYKILKGKFQSDGWITGAKVDSSSNVSNAFLYLSSKWKGITFCNNLHRGNAIFEKSLKNM